MKNSNKDIRQEIKDILWRNDKTKSWLKNKMRTNIDLYYLLGDNCVNFDVKVYQEIMDIFRKEGFITDENDRCEKFAEQLIQVNGIISHSTYLLNSNASMFLKDNVLDFKEKKKLLEIIDKMKTEFNSEIDNITKVIEG